ncbi:MAG: DNA primase [Deltaproteobacteria bacterium]|jgi:DNA primase|nr:DNA primase [Deltaproteobacteria bacterium]
MRNDRSELSVVKQAVKARLSIVAVVERYISLTPAGGGRFKAPCPFHSETNPSFYVYADSESFHCFGCKASGDIFEFYCKYHGLGFMDALRQLALEAGVHLGDMRVSSKAAEEQERRSRLFKMHELAQKRFRANLYGNGGKEAREYIAGRALDDKLAESFELGWSLDDWQDVVKLFQRAGYTEEHGLESGLLKKSEKAGRIYDAFRSRLMFPIKDLHGRVIAFGGRVIGQDKEGYKYINSPDTPIYKKGDHLYGLAQARRAISARKSVLITEGYMDVLTLHQFGYNNACGALGVALTPEHVARLRGLTSDLELIFDGDSAGREAAFRSVERILLHGLKCRVVTLPEDPQAKDIDLLLKGHGVKAFEDLRAKAPDGLTYCMRVLNNRSPGAIMDWVRDFLHKFKLERPEFVSKYISDLALGLGLEERVIRREVERAESVSGDAPGQRQIAPAPPPRWERDRRFIVFALRYPRYIHTLEQKGLEFILETPRGASLWLKLCGMSPHEVEEDIFEDFSAEDRQFCLYCRHVDLPPPDDEAEEQDCRELCESIERLIQYKNRHSNIQTVAALRGLRTGEEAAQKARSEDGDVVNELFEVYNRAAQQRMRKEHE